jgi:hypothetical protein
MIASPGFLLIAIGAWAHLWPVTVLGVLVVLACVVYLALIVRAEFEVLT